MMKANLYRSVLFVLFFGLLLALWGLDLSGVRTTIEHDRRADRVLPDLIDTPEAEIRRVVIDRGKEHLVFERPAKGPGRWQMLEPKDVAAEPGRLDALVRNLRELHKDPDAGTVQGDPGTYGLATPAATVRLYAGPSGSTSAERPVAELELGNSVRGRRYVRPAGQAGIQVVDARLLSAVDEPAVDWRQPNMLPVPTFQVRSVRITRRDQPDGHPRLIKAQRGASGQWRLELSPESTAEKPRSEPIEVLANGPKVESLLGALSSLRVAEPPKGYVADDVKDLSAFGLDNAAISVEVQTDRGNPMVLEIGKAVPDDPERVYLRDRQQDDVVMVESRALTEVPVDSTALRSQQVADIVLSAVTEIEIGTRTDVFKLQKDHGVWDVTSPRKDRADAPAVLEFLTHIHELQASEFLDPKVVPDPILDPPVMRIKLRQAEGGRPSAGPTAANSPTVLDLRLGRHDIARRTIFGRLEGDGVILALPDKLLEVLPRNRLAFRDRGVVTDQPDKIKRLTIRRGARVDELVPESKGEPNAWRMLRPIEARADTPTITQVLTTLCSLRAKDFAALSASDIKDSGLDRPTMEIAWESDGTHHLKIGAPVPRSPNFYAITDAEPMVFTLPATTLRALDAEYHDHRVMSFAPGSARRVVLRLFGRTVALRHKPAEKRGQVEWVPEPGTDITGLDLTRMASLLQTMATLQTPRFIQYEGEIPIDTGLSRPRLTIEVTLGPKDPVRVLRIGDNAGDGSVCAATGTGSTGAAFLLPGPSWNELIRSGERLPDLPADVFAPPSTP